MLHPGPNLGYGQQQGSFMALRWWPWEPSGSHTSLVLLSAGLWFPGRLKVAPPDFKVGLPACPCPQCPATWKTQIYLRTDLCYLCWETRLHIGKFQQPKMAFLKGPSLITQLQKGFLPSLKPQSSCGGRSCEALARNHVQHAAAYSALSFPAQLLL